MARLSHHSRRMSKKGFRDLFNHRFHFKKNRPRPWRHR